MINTSILKRTDGIGSAELPVDFIRSLGAVDSRSTGARSTIDEHGHCKMSLPVARSHKCVEVWCRLITLLDRVGTRILTVGEWTQDDGPPACAAWKPKLEIFLLLEDRWSLMLIQLGCLMGHVIWRRRLGCSPRIHRHWQQAICYWGCTDAIILRPCRGWTGHYFLRHRCCQVQPLFWPLPTKTTSTAAYLGIFTVSWIQ